MRQDDKEKVPEPSDKEEKRSTLFRKGAEDKLTSPEHLDQLLEVVRPKAWVALLGVIILLVAVTFWAIFGIIPVEVRGKGVFLTERGFFGISSEVQGIVSSIPVKLGSWVEENSVIAVLEPEDKEKPAQNIYALNKGRIVELDISVGDYINLGSQVGFGEYPLDPGETLVCHAFFPPDVGEKIAVGMEAKINVENVNTEIWGYLLAKVSFISEFPASDRNLSQILRNPQLINYFKKGQIEIISVHLKPIVDQSTVSGYAWTTASGPPKYLKTGTLCDVRIVLQERKPISYIFPLFFNEKTKPIGSNPNIFPENLDKK